MTKTTPPAHERAKVKKAATPRRNPRPAAKRTRSARQSAFLEAFRDTGTLNGAARKTDIGRGSHYRWIQQDQE